MFSGLNFKLIAIVIAVIAIFGLYKYVGHLKGEIKDLEQQNTVLSTQIQSQNTAIQQWKDDADLRLKAAQDDLKVAKEAADKNKGQAQVIYKTKPSTPGNDCKSALDLINGAK
jgi:hypothetical protein